MPHKKSKQRRSKKQSPKLDAPTSTDSPFFLYQDPASEQAADQNAQKAIQGQATDPIAPIPSLSIQTQKDSSGTASPSPATTNAIKHSQTKGQSLPSTTQKNMEQAFGQSFNQVSIHTDAAANQANKDLKSRAFTLGKNIYFKNNQYQPHTLQGQELIAHELTHVVQQKGQAMIQRSGEEGESTAPLIPRFHQKSHTCGVSSVLTAMLIFDQNNGNHQLLQSGVQKTLTRYEQRGDSIGRKLTRLGLEGASEVEEIKSILQTLNAQLANPNYKPTQPDYNNLAFALYYIYFNHDPKGGAGVALLAGEINSIMIFLGFDMSASGSKFDQVYDFIDVFGKPTVTELKAGEIAQVRAEVRQKMKSQSEGEPVRYTLFQHAFIIGRLQDGTWFFHDQGYKPPFIKKGSSLMDVELDVHEASTNETYWLVPGRFQTPGDVRLLKI